MVAPYPARLSAMFLRLARPLLAVCLVVPAGSGCRRESPAAVEAPAGAAGADSPSPDRGRRVYREGRGRSDRPIDARIGGNGISGVAGLAPGCANCHGDDGRGRFEGGALAPDITWDALIRPLGVYSNRRRPGYNDATLARVLSLGTDPDGVPLDPAMPRYHFTQGDFDDLVAYLKSLRAGDDPGVSGSALRLGVVLAPGAGHGPIRELLSAYVRRVNEEGGIYGRRLELAFAESPSDSSGRAEIVGRLMASGDVFALVAPLVVGIEHETNQLATSHRVPVIGPLTPAPPADAERNRFVFYLDGGSADLVCALTDFIAATETSGRSGDVAVILDEGSPMVSLADVIDERLREAGRPRAVRSSRGPSGARDVATRLRDAGTTFVFPLLVGEWGGELLREAMAIGWRPTVLLPASMAGRSLLHPPREFGGRIVVAMPAAPSDLEAAATRELRELAGGVASNPAAQRAVIVAAKLAVDALRRSGRDLTRDRMIAALEDTRDFRTGLGPPLSFGAVRRIGARGAYLLAIDPASGRAEPLGGWHAVTVTPEKAGRSNRP
jgi:ABC-type branched-subunit amino acid transport system substrate-binding protein